MQLSRGLEPSHINASILTTEMKFGVDAPVANMCPQPGEMYSFGIRARIDKKEQMAKVSRAISELTVRYLASTGMAIDSTMSDIRNVWDTQMDAILRCDENIIIPPGSLNIFKPSDATFILDECSASNVSPTQLEKLSTIVEKADWGLIDRVVMLSAELNKHNRQSEYEVGVVLDPEFAKQKNRKTIEQSVLTAAGKGSWTKLIQPSSLGLLSETSATRYVHGVETTVKRKAHDNATDLLWRSSAKQKAGDIVSEYDLDDRVRAAKRKIEENMQLDLRSAKTEEDKRAIRDRGRKELKEKTEEISSRALPKNQFLTDIFSLIYHVVYCHEHYGLTFSDVLCNQRTETVHNVTKEGAFIDQFEHGLDRLHDLKDKSTTIDALTEVGLELKENYGKLKLTPAAEIEKWADIRSRATLYRTHLRTELKDKCEIVVRGISSDVLDEFCKHGYSKGERWVIICDIAVILYAKRTRYLLDDKKFITAKRHVVRAITGSLMKCIDNFENNVRMQNCLIMMVKASWLTVGSHHLLRSDPETVKVRAEWHTSSLYMKALLHSKAIVEAILCSDRDLDCCLGVKTILGSELVKMIPETASNISSGRQQADTIESLLTPEQVRLKRMLEDMMIFAEQVQKGLISNWYHEKFEGLGIVHGILRPILVACTLLMLDDMTSDDVAKMDKHLNNAHPTDRLTCSAVAETIRTENVQMVRIVEARHLSDKYVVSLVKILKNAVYVQQALAYLRQDRENEDLPQSSLLDAVVSLGPITEIADTQNATKTLDYLSDLTKPVRGVSRDFAQYFREPDTSELRTEFYQARDNAVVLSLGRCILPFLANIADIHTDPRIPKQARTTDDIDYWQQSPQGPMLRRIKYMYDWAEDEKDLMPDKRKELEEDWKSLLQNIKGPLPPTIFPPEMAKLNAQIFVSGTKAYACATWIAEGVDCVKPFLDRPGEQVSLTKQDLNQRRMTYLQNMLSYINQALDLVQKRHSEDGVPQTSCPGTVVGYWRSAAAGKFMQDNADAVGIGDGSRAQITSILHDIRGVVANSVMRTGRPGIAARWRQRDAGTYGNMTMFGSSRAMGFGADGTQTDWENLEAEMQVALDHFPFIHHNASALAQTRVAPSDTRPKGFGYRQTQLQEWKQGARPYVEKASDIKLTRAWKEAWKAVDDAKIATYFDLAVLQMIHTSFCKRHDLIKQADVTTLTTPHANCVLAFLTAPLHDLADSLFHARSRAFKDGAGCSLSTLKTSATLEYVENIVMSHFHEVNRFRSYKVHNDDFVSRGEWCQGPTRAMIFHTVASIRNRAYLGIAAKKYRKDKEKEHRPSDKKQEDEEARRRREGLVDLILYWMHKFQRLYLSPVYAGDQEAEQEEIAALTKSRRETLAADETRSFFDHVRRSARRYENDASEIPFDAAMSKFPIKDQADVKKLTAKAAVQWLNKSFRDVFCLQLIDACIPEVLPPPRSGDFIPFYLAEIDNKGIEYPYTPPDEKHTKAWEGGPYAYISWRNLHQESYNLEMDCTGHSLHGLESDLARLIDLTYHMSTAEADKQLNQMWQPEWTPEIAAEAYGNWNKCSNQLLLKRDLLSRSDLHRVKGKSAKELAHELMKDMPPEAEAHAIVTHIKDGIKADKHRKLNITDTAEGRFNEILESVVQHHFDLHFNRADGKLYRDEAAKKEAAK